MRARASGGGFSLAARVPEQTAHGVALGAGDFNPETAPGGVLGELDQNVIPAGRKACLGLVLARGKSADRVVGVDKFPIDPELDAVVAAIFSRTVCSTGEKTRLRASRTQWSPGPRSERSKCPGWSEAAAGLVRHATLAASCVSGGKAASNSFDAWRLSTRYGPATCQPDWSRCK